MFDEKDDANSTAKETEESLELDCLDHHLAKRCNSNQGEQYHVHEVQGLCDSSENGSDAHTHRLRAVSSDPQSIAGDDHVHFVIFKSDFHDGHYHEGWGATSGACNVGSGHVHFLNGISTLDDGHWHKYLIATSLDGFYGG